MLPPPPTDSELLKLGLGFDTGPMRTLTPPDIIAADINSYRSHTSSSSSAAAAPIHTSSYLSPPIKQNITNQNIPTEVRAAVEMAKAHKRGNNPNQNIRNAAMIRPSSNSTISEMV